MVTNFGNIEIIYPDDMPEEEAISYVQEQRNIYPKLVLLKIELKFDHSKNNVYVMPQYDTIERVRRITGYLSTLPKFNDAKRAEERDRVSHFDGLTAWPRED